MKKHLASFAATILLSALTSAQANTIVYGTITGVVTSTSQSQFFSTRVGMPVTGTFSYDYDLLSAPDASGNRTVSLNQDATFRKLRSQTESSERRDRLTA